MPITIKLMLSAGGVGLIPFAPGTFASLVAVIMHYCIIKSVDEPMSIVISLTAMFLACVVTLVFGSRAECDSEDGTGKDPGWVVSDEVAGQLLAAAWFRSPALIIVAFILFRFFDIAKPLGIHRLQRYHGGKGILIDDLVAGIYALILTVTLGGLAPVLGLPDGFFL